MHDLSRPIEGDTEAEQAVLNPNAASVSLATARVSQTGTTTPAVSLPNIILSRVGSPILRCVSGNLRTRDEGHDKGVLADRAVAVIIEAMRRSSETGQRVTITYE